MKSAVLGAGEWGTALATVLARKGLRTVLFGRREEYRSINEKHVSPLFPGQRLDPAISYTTSLSEALDGASLLVFAVPSGAYRSLARQVRPLFPKDALVLSLAKGFDPESHELLSETLKEELGLPSVVSLIGPSFASEVLERKLTCVSAVSSDRNSARKVQSLLSDSYFRVYTNTDEVGAQVASALKNVLAIASGMLTGRKEGENARAALITRGLYEMSRLGLALGGRETFFGLTGVGDVVLTCSSTQSRNFRLGLLIGENNGAGEVLRKNVLTTEGVNTSKYATELSRKMGLELPITATVYEVLFEGLLPSEAIPLLMNRALKDETGGDLMAPEKPGLMGK